MTKAWFSRFPRSLSNEWLLLRRRKVDYELHREPGVGRSATRVLLRHVCHCRAPQRGLERGRFQLVERGPFTPGLSSEPTKALRQGAYRKVRDAFLARNVITVKDGQHNLPYLIKLTTPPPGASVSA